MMTRKSLLALALPLSFSAMAKVQIIPKAEQDIKMVKAAQAGFMLKNAKGTLLQKTLAEGTPANWFNLSPVDGVEGVRTEETYSTFGMPKSEEIIVAVIDSGVDVNHEDLQGKIWINSDEIPNNGIDDDNNGYVDDVFGWNFIGGVKGQAKIVEDRSLANGIRLVKGDSAHQIDGDSLEVTRELVRMKKLKARVEELGETLTSAQADYLESLSKIVTGNLENAKAIVEAYTTRLDLYKKSEAILKAAGLATISIEEVRALESQDPAVQKAKKDMLTLLSNGLTEARLNRVLEHYKAQVEFQYNESYDPRSIVGDNYLDLSERFYGNNDVIGPDASHGTHVSGSIAAVRDNNLGIKGVATNVKIMAVRVVPNGDERDKDVANGIRYAVDNGARVINMSFGKAYSPFKRLVDDAVRYAESKGVLMVHAAGNDNKDNDKLPSYPSRFDGKGTKEFSNWLEIGASSFKKGLTLPAEIGRAHV